MVEVGPLIAVFAEDASHPLNELQLRFSPRDVDADFSIRDVNPPRLAS